MHFKYFRYLHQTNTVVSTIISTIKIMIFSFLAPVFADSAYLSDEYTYAYSPDSLYSQHCSLAEEYGKCHRQTTVKSHFSNNGNGELNIRLFMAEIMVNTAVSVWWAYPKYLQSKISHSLRQKYLIDFNKLQSDLDKKKK